MPGADLSGMQRVLGRIEEIKTQTTAAFRNAQTINGDPGKNKFIDVLNKAKNSVKQVALSNKTSYEELKEVIDKYADKYNMDQELIRAMIQVESGWNTDAVSNKGALGLMQLMPKTAAMLGVNPNDPIQNLEGGIRYISDLTDKYRGDIEKALAAYNAGPARVDSGQIPEVSKRYVKNIMSIYNKLRSAS